MKNFKVLLTRNYVVDISADNEEDAKFLSEFYISNVKDGSDQFEQSESKFNIHNIRMTFNEALEVEETYEVK